MFHTLFDYQDQNVSNNRQIPKGKSRVSFNNSSRDSNTYYYGKGNNAYDSYNKNENDSDDNEINGDINDKFEKTKNKIKLIVYKNGFILNNGKFRDKFIPENAEFLEQVGRGVIPHELAEKGMSDLGILLINRKTEIYPPHKLKTNSFGNFDFFKTPYQNIDQNQYNFYKPKTNNIIPLGMSRVHSSKDLHKIPKKIELNKNNKKIMRQNCSEPKGNEKEKKFTAFSGSGKLIRSININGLRVNKNIKTVFDIYQPVCTVSIRLFNGEVAKCHFNYSQTLRDIYYHVRRISGSNNFYLLDGFPPRPLRDYDRTIYELRLQNSLLTQKIN